MNHKKQPAQNPLPGAQYFNRELSWLDFNERVLAEGLRKDLPPLERFRFLAIVSSNLDEFFMVRVAALKKIQRSGNVERDSSGLSPAELLAIVSERTAEIIKTQYRCLTEEIFPCMAAEGLSLVRAASYTDEQKKYLESWFDSRVYPVLTPLRIEEGEELPAIDSLSLNCVFLLRGGGEASAAEDKTAMVLIPPVLDRIIHFPGDSSWTLLEDLVLSWGGKLFPGFEVLETMLFKVNRDADFSVDEKRDEDFIEAMEEVLESRDRSTAVRMSYSRGSDRLRDMLARRLSLDSQDLYEIPGPLNLGALDELVNVPGFDRLREKNWKIYANPGFSEDTSIWDTIREKDMLLHLPYESFDPVLRFFQEAAQDPDVIAIKTCLYRTSGNSPIVRALEQASLSGKHVTAVVELKARFDEERNISWANRLEKAGAVVVYGLARLKVHGKIALVVRKEGEQIRRYLHLSTGNYNDKTARLYEDLSLFSCREELAYDAGILFNMISGYSMIQPTRLISIAPVNLKRRLLELIEREERRSSAAYPGRIMAKLNALVDQDIIQALYRASRAGVKISLCVRGICTLIPGMPELSENIRVISVVGHYLEHSRICYFANGGADELYLSSADWMPRNLERRVELMFPVLQEDLRRRVYDILLSYFEDNCQAWRLGSGGSWERLEPETGAIPYRVQQGMLAAAAKAANRPEAARMDFTVRKSGSSFGLED
ncbi:MAG: polyphosphate kinase 1 [Treponema sp.]|jgi:polyphosphate kinase|nr:polyphosphate kinase 1 [Treponema sp.]